MRLIVISDTHIPERIKALPNRILRQIKRGDVVFHCGDFTSLKVYENLRGIVSLYGVVGNMDEKSLHSILPEKQVIEIRGKRIGIIHGWGSPIGLESRVYNSFDDKPDIIVFGHSHTRTNHMINNTLLFNPGSVAGGWNHEPSFGELFIENNDIRCEYHGV